LEVLEKGKRDTNLLKYVCGSNNLKHPDKEFNTLLNRFKQAEREATKFIRELSTDTTDPLDDFEDEEETEKKLSEMKTSLQQKFRELCFKYNRVQPKLIPRADFRNKQLKYMELLNALTEYFTLEESLLKNTDIHTKEYQLHTKLMEKQQRSNNVNELQEQLNIERTLRHNQNDEFSGKIRRLQKESSYVNTKLKQNQESTDKRITEEKKKLQTDHLKTKDNLNNTITDIKKKLEADSEEHKAAEIDEKKKLKRNENELKEIIESYDTEMISLKTEINKLEHEMKIDSEKFQEIEKKMLVLKEEREKIEAVEAEKLRKERLIKAQKDRAATQIQSNFRGWKTRRELKNKKGKGKKGKGKKGKGKKKKS